MVYVRQKDLPKLHEYKYQGVDHSYVSKHILKPFYSNVAIKFFPMWMAPNAITLSGFAFVVINFLTVLWYNPSLDQDMPPWVYASMAAGLFLYQTFDALDGQQARRTKQSGPLGELFDHGVDALNVAFEVVLFAASMNLGQGWKTILVLFGCAFTFYVQTWEEYYTQTLTLGVVSGPVEGVLTLCMTYAITAFVGRGSFWAQSAMRTVGVPEYSWIPKFIYEMPFNEGWIYFGSAILLFNLYQCAVNVANAQKNPAPHTKDHISPLMNLAPAITTWVLVPIYLWLQPIILYEHLIPFVIYVGLINAYSVGKIITAHLVKSKRFPITNSLLIPLWCAVGDSIGPKFGLWPSILGSDVYQIAFMFSCLGLAVGVHGSFIYDCITTICDYLDIWCLTIKYPQGKPEDGEQKSKKKS